MKFKRYSEIIIRILICLYLISVLIGIIFKVSDTLPTKTSVQWAFELAWESKLIFGESFVSIFGPLGFLQTRYPLVINPWIYYVLDGFMLTNIFLVLFNVLARQYFAFPLRVILVILLTFQNDIGLLWLALLLFWICYYFENRHLYILINIVAIGIVLLLLKFDTGLIALLFLLTFFLSIKFIHRLPYVKLIGLISATIFSYLLIAWIFGINIFQYLKNGFSLIGDPGNTAEYQVPDAMKFLNYTMALVCLLLLIIPLLIHYKKYYLGAKHILLYHFLVFFFCLYLFKYTLIQNKAETFFGFIIIAAGLILFFTKQKREIIIKYSLFPIILISFVFLFTRINLIDRLSQFLRPDRNIKNYFSSLDSWVKNSGEITHRDQPITADVFNVDIGELLRHSLDYLPRPVPDGESISNDRLDKYNAYHIAQSGPKYFLVKPTPDPNRYFLFEEPSAKLEWLINYEIDSIFNKSTIISKKRKSPPPVMITPIMEGIVNFEDSIRLIGTDEIQIAYPEVEYSWLGAIANFFIGPPELSILLLLNNGSVKSYRFSKDLGKSGVIINKYLQPDNFAELQWFVKYYGRLNPNVKSFRLSSTSMWAFKSKFNLRLEQVKIDEHPVPVDRMYQPLVADLKSLINVTSNIRANIESFTEDNSRIDCFGWAFVDEPDASKLLPSVILEAEDHTLIFPVLNKLPRPDVKAVISTNAGDSTGISLTIYREFLRNSNYKVGFAFLENGRVKRRTLLTNYQINNSGKNNFQRFKKFKSNPTSVGEEIVCNIENLVVKEDFVSVYGWAFRNGKLSSKYDSISVVLKSSDDEYFIASTSLNLRPDVSSYFKNAVLDSTGFYESYSLEGLESGDYEIGILIKENKKDDGIIRFVKSVSLGYPDEFLITRFTNSCNEISKSAIQFEIDELKDSYDMIVVKGWAFLPERHNQKYKVEVLLQSEDNQMFLSKTKPVERPDVYNNFNGKFDVTDSGFEAIISKKALPKGVYKIGLRLIYYAEPTGNVCYFTDSYCNK